MMRLFFITTVDPERKTGGALVRKGTISQLRKNGYNVIVVKPGSSFSSENEGLISTCPFKSDRWTYFLECLGLVKDANYKWIRDSYNHLSKIVTTNDLLFVTSGGTMAPLLLAKQVKEKTGCKVIANYHDPTNFTKLDNEYGRKNAFFHINRDKIEASYIDTFDYIITSSEAYKRVLTQKYPYISNKIICNYFGYLPIDISEPCEVHLHNTVNIVYGGNFGPSQAPEILAEAVADLDGVEAFFVGNSQGNSSLNKYAHYSNIHLIPQMPFSQYCKFLVDNADIGFFSLRNAFSKYCVPSKLYDFINLGIPVIGLVNGDAKDIIENHNIGKVCSNSVEDLKRAIQEMKDERTRFECKQNIQKIRDQWSMSYRIREVCDIINTL